MLLVGGGSGEAESVTNAASGGGGEVKQSL